MSIYSDIAKKISEIRGANPSILFVAKVKEVNGDVCTIEIGDLELTDVRLCSVVNDDKNKLLITPAKDSMVTVADLSDGEMRTMVVVQYSSVEKINLKIEDTTLEITSSKVCINGGDNDGLIKIADLTNKLNELVNAFNNHTHSGVVTAVSGGSGAPVVGTPGNTGTPVTSAATFNKTDYEDTKVTH